MKIETHFLVPIHEDKDVGRGELDVHYRWEELEDDLEAEFSGWTLATGLYEGKYERIREKSKMYLVALDEEDVPRLRKYLKEKVAVNFRQEVIYFFDGREVQFIESAEREI